jgi:hypothetical protein
MMKSRRMRRTGCRDSRGRRGSIGGPRRGKEDNIKMNLKKNSLKYGGVDLPGLGWGEVVSCSEHSKQVLRSTKCGQIL